MIKPHKYLNLESSIVSIVALIIVLLRDNKVMKYDELFDILHNEKGDSIKYNFILALDFLFLLGKLQYYSVTDTLELIK